MLNVRMNSERQRNLRIVEDRLGFNMQSMKIDSERLNTTKTRILTAMFQYAKCDI